MSGVESKNGRNFSLVITRGDTAGKRFLLTTGTNLVGRWDPDQGAFPEVDLEQHDPEAKVSRRHAIITVTENALFIEDVGSMNGTFVNRGKRLAQGTKQQLNDGDEIIVGKTFMAVEDQRRKL